MPYLMKTTFSFAGLEQGWSETFYWNAVSDDLAVAETLVDPLAKKRAKLLASGYTLTVVRNANIANTVGTKLKRVTDLAEPRYAGISTWKPSQPNVALMCVWQTGNNRASKKQYMRGVPAGIGDAGKMPDLAYSTFLSNFNSWREAMIQFGAGWLVGEVARVATILSYTVNPTTAQVTFALSPGLAPWPVAYGVKTRVYVQIPGKSPLDGPLIVVPTSDTSAYTPAAHPAAPLPTGQIGTMLIREPRLVTLSPSGIQSPPGSIHPQRMVTHKTGRPSYASRGRVAAPVKW